MISIHSTWPQTDGNLVFNKKEMVISPLEVGFNSHRARSLRARYALDNLQDIFGREISTTILDKFNNRKND